MERDKKSKIVILGLSNNPERYSYLAYKKLIKFGHTNLVGITPKKIDFTDILVVKLLSEVEGDVDTLTLYVGEKRLEPIIDDIIRLAPKRIIFNPGTENQNLMAKARYNDIEVVEGCTLVMLSSKQF